MDFFNYLKTLDEEQIKTVISMKISELAHKSTINKKRFIGIDCDINPSFTLGEKEQEDSKSMWFGYIPEDVKVVYWLAEYKGYAVNNGGYYYMDDSIVYEFALFAKNKKANNYLEFLDLIWEFADKYFNNLNPEFYNRDSMLSPLLKTKDWYYEPTVEHSITTFKGRNNAMCSEYSAIAQNILSVYGYQSMYFIGSVKCDYGVGPHAYNIAIIEGHPLLLDYTVPVRTYDLKGNIIAYSPFVGIIKNFNTDTLINSSKNSEPLDFPEYDFYLLGDNLSSDNIQYNELDTTRYYAIGNIKFFEEHKNYQKKPKELKKIIL